MRVAYVISSLEKCGPVNVLYEIAKNLGEEFECSIFTLAKEPENTRIADFQALGINVTCVVGSRIQSLIMGARLLANKLSSWHPDVVHVHGYRATVLAQRLPYMKVATIHNCIFEDFKDEYPLLQAKIMERSEVSALRHFDRVVACSESNADYIRKHYNFNIGFIRNGVDQSIYHPVAPQMKSSICRSLGITPESIQLLSSGVCCERKASLLVAKAVETVVCHRDGVEYHAIGSGPLLEECRALDIEREFFHGFRDDVVDWLQACDLYISASLSEGMPMAVLEAVSCGMPLLLSDIPPHREIASALEGQNCVLLFKAGSIKALSSALISCLDTPLSRPSDVSCFSSTTMAKGYGAVYKEI